MFNGLFRLPFESCGSIPENSLKRSISGQEEPGVRYDAYKLDYGCYVDLLATTRAPTHELFENESDDESLAESIKVPTDDYRAIRRAILDLNEFENRTREGVPNASPESPASQGSE